MARGPKESQESRPGESTTLGGVSFWRLIEGARTTEINTHDELVLGVDGARWDVAAAPGEPVKRPIESASPAVRGFLRRVADEKARIARLRGPVGPPLAKPRNPGRAAPANAPVPCPLCRPGADASQPGEPWFDCELCDGAGVVTARQAEAWRGEKAYRGHD